MKYGAMGLSVGVRLKIMNKLVFITIIFFPFLSLSKTGTASINIVPVPKPEPEIKCYEGEQFIFCEDEFGNSYTIKKDDGGMYIREYE